LIHRPGARRGRHAPVRTSTGAFLLEPLPSCDAGVDDTIADVGILRALGLVKLRLGDPLPLEDPQGTVDRTLANV
jgi:hypothetical protein